MKPKGYILFTTLSNIKSLKLVLKCLKELGISGATVMDSIGSANLYNFDDIYVPMIASSMKSVDSVRSYGKTVFSVIKDEDTLIKAMDELENILDLNINDLGKGIMFSIPIYVSMGVL
ncbi:MAG: hypothetical protein GX308_07580 [Epulopiscium sp.]|nr:hypothetical protein [Candidatus Epulonipiscium sp.]